MFILISGVISTKTLAELYVSAIETTVVVVAEGTLALSVSIRASPPIVVLPVLNTLSSRL